MKITTTNTKPNDMDVSKHLFDSDLKNYEKETIARNIILISQKNNNQWFAFSFEEYKKRCTHKVSVGELEILDMLVTDGLLSYSDGLYTVQDKFLITLIKFIVN